MNTQAIAIERNSRRPLMSGLHGGWSIGAFTGAGIGAVAVGAGIALTPQLLILGSVALLGAGLLGTRLLPDHRDGSSSEPFPSAPSSETEIPTTEPASGGGRSRWSAGMLTLAVIAFASLLCEGAAANWASVYLSGPLGATGAVPGSLRRVHPRHGRRATLGQPAASPVSPRPAPCRHRRLRVPWASGAWAWGWRQSCPPCSGAAGRLPGLHPGTAVATVSAFGWAAYVIGPPIIGHLAALTSLPTALAVLPVLTGFVALGSWLAPGLKNPQRQNDRPLRAVGTP